MYFEADHLNPLRYTTIIERPRVVWRGQSDAFESSPTEEDPDGDGQRTVINLRFPGQYFDAESGLYYNWWRYYDPVTGRYTQPDTIGLAGGMNAYAYVSGNPLTSVDATGLDPWARETWTPARVFTDMGGGTTVYFDPMTRDLLTIPSRNAVTSKAEPGAEGPYSGYFTFCQFPNSLEFGTAKWRTTDPRLRWIHGGGSSLGDPGALLPRQGWAPTQGCTRAQNEDVETLCKKSEDWQRVNPGQRIPYSRW